jgi:hypothetical protein
LAAQGARDRGEGRPQGRLGRYEVLDQRRLRVPTSHRLSREKGELPHPFRYGDARGAIGWPHILVKPATVWSNGIARAFASTGSGAHAVRDDPRAAQKSVL